MRRRDSERGATAVLMAALAVVLFGMGAVATDMGQAYAQRRDLQTNVDAAVMAAVAQLDGSLPDKGYGASRTVAEQYLMKNEVFNQVAMDLSCVANDENGCLELPADGNDWKLRLYAPRVEVDLGMANIFSSPPDIKVPAMAAAEVKSPGGSSTLPMYAVDGGCDYGNQTIADAPSGHTDPYTVPPLVPSTGTFNNAAFTVSPEEVDAELTPNVPITLTGTNLAGITEVGFTNSAGDHFTVDNDGDGNDFTVNAAGTSVVVDSIPAEVLLVQDYWFVRVLKGGLWSDTAAAQMLIVGERLYCSGSVSGNYGALRMPRTDSPSGKWLALNVIKGVEPALELHPSPPADNNCKGDPLPTVESDSGPVDGTNCLATEPGFPGNELTDGLITGAMGYPGRLDQDTTPGCGRSGSARTVATPSGPSINDDLLTCFMTSPSVPISRLVAGTADNVLSADIMQSPRFFWMPVVPVEPEAGHSKSYPIVERRPGFVTDQPLTATKNSPSIASMSSWAGINFNSNKVESLRVILFDEDALPDTAVPTGDEIAYTGSGTKILTLVE